MKKTILFSACAALSLSMVACGGNPNKAKNAEALVADVRAKIERAREEMASTIEKVKLIDRQAAEETPAENNDK